MEILVVPLYFMLVVLLIKKNLLLSVNKLFNILQNNEYLIKVKKGINIRS